MNRKIFACVILLVPHGLQAAGNPNSTQTNFPIGYLSILGFTGGSDLSDIQKKLGSASYAAIGSRATLDDGTTFCYASNETGDKTALVFEGSGEMGLSDFKVFTPGDRPETIGEKCVASSAVSRTIETPSHLRLGMDVRVLIDQLGLPTSQFENDLRWLRWKRCQACELSCCPQGGFC